MEDRRAPEAAGPYSTLLEINNAIISNLTQDSLFHAISEALRKVVPFDRALLYVAENDVLRTIALEGREPAGRSSIGSRASVAISRSNRDSRGTRSCSPGECAPTSSFR